MKTTLSDLTKKAGALKQRVIKLAENEGDGVWRTVRGRRIFIGKGQSLDDALKQSLGKKGIGEKKGKGEEGRLQKIGDHLTGQGFKKTGDGWERPRGRGKELYVVSSGTGSDIWRAGVWKHVVTGTGKNTLPNGYTTHETVTSGPSLTSLQRYIKNPYRPSQTAIDSFGLGKWEGKEEPRLRRGPSGTGPGS